jgi:hypothetical protein
MPFRFLLCALLIASLNSCSVVLCQEPEIVVPMIAVRDGDWGDANTADIAAVATSAARELCKQIQGTELLDPIEIYKSEGPITLFDRLNRGEYQVGIAIDGRFWSQCAYQFSHEFCHILSRYDTNQKYQWFQETICEVASLYTLRQMAESWKNSPPFPNWKSYAPSLGEYAQNRMDAAKLPEGESLSDFMVEHLHELNENGGLREANTTIATELLSLFEADPTNWRAVAYLNVHRDEDEPTFAHFLAGWRKRVPPDRKEFVEHIAQKLGVELP